LVGNNGGTISNSYSTSNVIGTESVGGLVGWNHSTISNSYSTGNVTGDSNVGGLVGDNFYGTTNNSYYDVDKVLINGTKHVTDGGLYHSQYQTWADNSYAALDIAIYSATLPYNNDGGYYTITTSQGLKDMLAFLYKGYTFRLGSNIDLSGLPDWHLPVFSGTFDGAGHTLSNLMVNQPFNDDIGFIGYLNKGTLANVGLTNVSVTGRDDVGGLVGFNDQGVIGNSYSMGAVNGRQMVGGLVGYNDGNISNSYSTGAVSGSSYVGGLVGDNSGGISSSYSTGAVNGSGIVGGLAGYNDSIIRNSYSTGTVSGNSKVGGLVGYNDTQGTINGAHSTGAVTGTNYVGGLVGYNIGVPNISNVNSYSISNSYSTGNVSGQNYVGGLVGYVDKYSSGSGFPGGLIGMINYNAVSNSYSTGAVSGSSNVGGLVGYDYKGTVSNSFWDVTTSGQTTSAGGTGLTTADFMKLANFTSATAANGNVNPGWDFNTTWWMSEGNTRPFLRSEYSTNITNAHQLQLMALNLGASYTLANNIDMSELTRASGMWNTSTGFVPIGNSSTAFTGAFDGLGHTLTGLYINRPTTDYVGLFGYTKGSSAIQNVGLIDVNITGRNYVGGLVGYNSGSITNAYNTGAVNGSSYAGGLVGRNYLGSISNSYSTGNVRGTGNYVGGLVGYNYSGTISNSYSAGTVTGKGGGIISAVGGLVGYNHYGTISNSYSTGNVTGNAYSYVAATHYVGGLVGYNYYGTISNSYSTGNVTGYSYVGGLVGSNSGTISNSYSTGDVSGGSDYIGGLVGSNSGTISNSYSMGNVTGNDLSYEGSSSIGGLVGSNSGTISNSYSTGNVTGYSHVGGLVGRNSGTISNSYSTGNVTGYSYVGGLVGYNYGSIINSYYDINNVFINGTHYVTEGGLYASQYADWMNNGYRSLDIASYSSTLPYTSRDVGYYTITTEQGLKNMLAFLDRGYTFKLGSNIDLSEMPDWHLPVFSGTFDGAGYILSNLMVNQSFNDHIGFVGHLNKGTLTDVGLTNISVTGINYVGGLVGTNVSGTINNSYSTGEVTGTGNCIGGLVGQNYYNSTINNSYSTGTVVTKTGTHIGGLVGYNYGSISNSYSTGDVSGGSDYIGGLVGYNLGKISYSYNTGTVTGKTYNYASNIGGLVGYNDYGTISNSSNTGAVSGTGPYIGGLVGYNDYGTISNSSSTGDVTGTSNVGGLVGYDKYGTISNSYYDIDNVFINGAHHVTEGGLYHSQFQTWADNGYAVMNIANYSATLPYNDDSGYYAITTSQGLKDMLAFLNMGYTFKLGSNIDLTGLPDWHLPVFKGTFDGAGYTLSNLTVNQPFNDYIGFIGRLNSGTLTNVGLTNIIVTGHNFVGGLAGYNGYRDYGTISNSYSTGEIGATNNNASFGRSGVGGLVGYNYGTISNSYSAVAVSGKYSIGGLVGSNYGTISNSYSMGNVTGNDLSYEGSSSIGGLVGYNYSTISNSYSTGAVSSRYEVGGLVGMNDGGTIINSYSTGAVSGSSNVGGLVGYNSGTITNSFWDTETSGQTSSAGGTGMTTTDFMNKANFTSATAANGNVNPGWDFNTTWWMSEGNTRPFLRSEYSTNITNAHQLQLMALNPGASYTLASNIDMSELKRASGIWNTSTGFVPIGSYNNSFRGAFDGQGHIITGLYINRPATDYVGLFGYAESSSMMQNVGLLSAEVTGQSYVGGLVGYNNGMISNSCSTGNINGIIDHVGGLVGYNDYKGNIDTSYSTGAINGTWCIGGLVGENDGNISNSYNTGMVNGTLRVGGLVGYNDSGSIVTSYNMGTVNGRSFVGGLVGWNYSGSIATSYSTGAVNGRDNIGGLVGGSDGGSMVTSYSMGMVSGKDGVGGLVGSNSNGTISNSYSTGNVVGSYYVGGLVGFINDGAISNSYSMGNVVGSYYVGGLVGYNFYGTISNSFSTGNVAGMDYVGGLVGDNIYGTISNSYSTGAVNGTNYVGGLLGSSFSGSIDTSYSTGAVSGNSNVGGLVGYNNGGSIGNSYSAGAVTGDGSVGGLVGYNYNGTVSNSYWNITTAGVANGIGYDQTASGPSNTGATGLTTNQMMQSANFTGFDFTNTWRIYEGHTTPLLKVFLKPLTITADDVTKVYDGTSVGLTNVAYSDPAAAGSSNLFGIATPYGSVVKNNVGVYSPDIWSNQQGYDITIGTQAGTYGTLTVTPRPVTVSSIADVNTPYGTAAATGAVNLTNVIANDTVYSTADIDNPVYNPGSNSLKANSYTQTASTLNGVDAGNYTLTPYTTPTPNYVVEPGQVVSGMFNVATAGKSIYFVVNGMMLADQGITDASGNYSAMFPLNSIGANSALLAYVANDSAVKSASVYVAPGGDISGLLLSANTLTASSSSGTMSNTTLGTAKGGITSSDIPFTVSGTDLSLTDGISFVVAGGTNYLVNGAITTQNGSQTYNGPLTLPGNATLTAAGTGGITFGGPVTGTDYNLTATAGGDITLGGHVNVGTGTVTLTSTDGAIINGMGGLRSITAETLMAYAANGIGSGDPLITGVHNLTAVNTVANNIEIDNTGVLAVGNMRNGGTGDVVLENIGKITTGTNAITSSGGNVSITAQSPLTIGTGGVSAYKNITLVTLPGSDCDDLTINGPLTSSTGNISLTAGSLIFFGPKGSMSAPQGTLMLKDGGLISAGNKVASNSTVISLSKIITNIIMADDDRDNEDEDENQNED